MYAWLLIQVDPDGDCVDQAGTVSTAARLHLRVFLQGTIRIPARLKLSSGRPQRERGRKYSIRVDGSEKSWEK
jgi:hypothetical protein